MHALKDSATLVWTGTYWAVIGSGSWAAKRALASLGTRLYLGAKSRRADSTALVDSATSAVDLLDANTLANHCRCKLGKREIQLVSE